MLSEEFLLIRFILNKSNQLGLRINFNTFFFQTGSRLSAATWSIENEPINNVHITCELKRPESS